MYCNLKIKRSGKANRNLFQDGSGVFDWPHGGYAILK